MNSILRETCLLLILLIPCLILSNRMGFGSILGLIAGGVIIGPSGFDFLESSGITHNISDIAVILFMFLVGLELHPAKIGKSWQKLLVFSILQIVLTGLLLTVLVLPTSQFWSGAFVTGFMLAMSSTALVLQTLRERGELNSKMGRTAIAILIVQDLAVIPLLALVPILNPRRPIDETASFSMESVLLILGAIALIISLNRFIAPRIIEQLDRRGDSNSLTFLIGLFVLGAALIADSVGLSTALGSFLVGISLSTCPSAKRIEQIVRPHQTLLMSLFFVSVGLSIDRHELTGSYWSIAAFVPCVVIGKILVLYVISRLMGTNNRISWRLAIILSQAGEFGFIICAASLSVGWATATQVAIGTTVIACTMILTPVIQRFITPLTDPDNS
ncbi:MAG: cation:proton antiporter [Planctomycetota bacterium]|nr:cation:proton antiporter [Planctomycetota bacterium]MDA1263254.1 cation:proton antiporter [Planctomycetota bacterium]